MLMLWCCSIYYGADQLQKDGILPTYTDGTLPAATFVRLGKRKLPKYYKKLKAEFSRASGGGARCTGPRRFWLAGAGLRRLLPSPSRAPSSLHRC